MFKSPCLKCFHHVAKSESEAATFFVCEKEHHELFLTSFNANKCPDYSKNKGKRMLPAILTPVETFKKSFSSGVLKVEENDKFVTGFIEDK